ncbi:MAG: hypothetical protein RR645_04980 [Clostridium sp.]
MDLNYGIIHCGYRHEKYTRCNLSLFDIKSFSRRVLKNETFAFQILLQSPEEFLCSVGKFNHISWKGLINRVRIEVDSDNANVSKALSISLVDYISDDNGCLVTDIISSSESILVEEGIAQLLWVKGMVPVDFEDNFSFNINLYYTVGYEEEELLVSIPCNINYINTSLPNLSDGPFYLDLWQHPCSLARQYDVKLWSDEHFTIIDNFIKELSTGGQKTITIVASDFPWAGQGCFNVTTNPSNLFEHNIISVIKNKDGNLKLNTTALIWSYWQLGWTFL